MKYISFIDTEVSEADMLLCDVLNKQVDSKKSFRVKKVTLSKE